MTDNWHSSYFTHIVCKRDDENLISNFISTVYCVSLKSMNDETMIKMTEQEVFNDNKNGRLTKRIWNETNFWKTNSAVNIELF